MVRSTRQRMAAFHTTAPPHAYHPVSKKLLYSANLSRKDIDRGKTARMIKQGPSVVLNLRTLPCAIR